MSQGSSSFQPSGTLPPWSISSLILARVRFMYSPRPLCNKSPTSEVLAMQPLHHRFPFHQVCQADDIQHHQHCSQHPIGCLLMGVAWWPRHHLGEKCPVLLQNEGLVFLQSQVALCKGTLSIEYWLQSINFEPFWFCKKSIILDWFFWFGNQYF